MIAIQSDPVKQMKLMLFDIKTANDLMSKRITRIESRLTQLMMHQGMQSDGRYPIQDRAANE